MALGGLGDARAGEPLLPSLQDQYLVVRREAVARYVAVWRADEIGKQRTKLTAFQPESRLKK